MCIRDSTGAYWGAKKACEHLNIQWNSSNNSIKAVNTTAEDLEGATAQATIYNLNGKEMAAYGPVSYTHLDVYKRQL